MGNFGPQGRRRPRPYGPWHMDDGALWWRYWQHWGRDPALKRPMAWPERVLWLNGLMAGIVVAGARLVSGQGLGGAAQGILGFLLVAWAWRAGVVWWYGWLSRRSAFWRLTSGELPSRLVTLSGVLPLAALVSLVLPTPFAQMGIAGLFAAALFWAAHRRGGDWPFWFAAVTAGSGLALVAWLTGAI